jgi:hypothetical protein
MRSNRGFRFICNLKELSNIEGEEMKRIVNVLLIGLMVLMASPSMAMFVSLTPSSQNVGVGEQFSIVVEAIMEPGESLSSLDFDIDYNSSILGYNSASGMMPGPEWGDNDFASADFGPGIANMNGSTFEADLSWQDGPGGFVISTFTFEALAIGMDVLDITYHDFFNESYEIDGNELHLESANINVVPIPGAVWLLGTGLMGLVGLRRKMKK